MPLFRWLEIFEFSPENGYLVLKFNNTHKTTYMECQLNLRSPEDRPDIREMTVTHALEMIARNSMKRVHSL